MPTEQVLQWIWNIGGPFIPVVYFLYLFYSNKIYTAKAVNDIIEAKNKTITDKDILVNKYITLLETNARIADKALDKYADEVRQR